MKITPDDPRLTAYALGELDPATRKAIEAELANSPELQREVDATTQTAATLSAEFAAEPLPELTYAQQLAIEAELASDSREKSPARTSALEQPFPLVAFWRKWFHHGLVFAATAVVLISLILAALHFSANGPGTTSLAETIARMQKAKTITWTTVFYMRQTSKDGKVWLNAETHQHAYKSPGLYRDTFLDQNGQIRKIEITDSINHRQLLLVPGKQHAVLSQFVAPSSQPQGPFADMSKILLEKDLQWLGTRKTPNGDVNIFRYSISAKDNPGGVDWSYDFWIDQKNKQLIQLHIPGADIFDPETDPIRNNPPGEFWSGTFKGGGSIQKDIVYDAELDDSLFDLQPPAGYTVETDTPPSKVTVTEKEVIDYLAILAHYNNQTFPDQVLPHDFTNDRINKVWAKPEQDRTPAEQKLIQIVKHYTLQLQEMPIAPFVHENTMDKSFRYFGKGVKLGDKDRIVCWYRLKNATTYRVVYADLTVKDLPPQSLPLPVEQ